MKLLKNRVARMYAECECVHPVHVLTRTGKRIIVGCGKCVLCLHKRRESWSKRLADEYKNPRCIHAFGFTLTYDSKHVPFLYYGELTHQRFDWESPNSSHTYLNMRRGCRPELLSRGIAVGLLSSRDIDLFIKKFRKKVETSFPNLFIRYYIVGEYGEHDECEETNDNFKRTARPHYHGLCYVYTKGKNDITESSILNYIATYMEQTLLGCWEHCKRFYDARKDKYVGKDVHKFGEKWGAYLGKYINKEITSQFDSCKGSRWIPERIWCSRQSVKYNVGSIGFNALSEVEIQDYLQKLQTAEKDKIRFEPTYNENGYTKALPRAYVNKFYERYFDVKMSRVQQFIYWVRYCSNASKSVYYSSILAVKQIIDPNDPFEINTLDISYEIPIKVIPNDWIKRINPYRALSSISTCPKHDINTFFEEVDRMPYFPQSEVKKILRFLDYRDIQTDLWCNQYNDNGSYSHQFLVNENELFQAVPHITDKTFFTYCREKRKATLNKASRILKKGLETKHNHELKNGYIR